ncbi:myb-related transcription factor, partner of profilin-like [Lissotriton helveticus]
MEKDAPQDKETPRKRKRKISDKELELLIEGVSSKHDRLFGKLSLKVPEAEKRKMWLHIKERVKTVGVTHHSIDDLKKRWYDLRKRAKERIAERVKDAAGTGGGISSVTPNTALEDLVEATIEPEAVVGVTQLDTSGAAAGGEDASPLESDDSGRLVISETPVVTDAGTPQGCEPTTPPSPPPQPSPPTPPPPPRRTTTPPPDMELFNPLEESRLSPILQSKENKDVHSRE